MALLREIGHDVVVVRPHIHGARQIEKIFSFDKLGRTLLLRLLAPNVRSDAIRQAVKGIKSRKIIVFADVQPLMLEHIGNCQSFCHRMGKRRKTALHCLKAAFYIFVVQSAVDVISLAVVCHPLVRVERRVRVVIFPFDKIPVLVECFKHKRLPFSSAL